MDGIMYAVILFIPVVILLSWSVVYLVGRVSKRQLDRRKEKSSIMIIVGSGGHTSEILRLSSVLGSHYSPRYYIVANTDKISEEKVHVLEKNSANTKETQYEVHRIPRSREVKQSWISTVLSTLYACIYSLPLVFKLRPDLILCNGPGTCIPLCLSGILLKIRNTLDHILEERTAVGIGTEKRKASVNTAEENKMWEDGVLDNDTPRHLLDTLVYLIGLNYAFRGGMEHRNLRFVNPQLTLVTSTGEEVLRYKEDQSKANEGGLTSRKLSQKIVYAFRNRQHPERCLIRYYKLYLHHCPEDKPPNSFYLRPRLSPIGSVWFFSMPVGINKLLGAVSRLCKEASLSGIRTNHSLRATAATRLYEAGCEEQLIAGTTGHRSDAVRQYKRNNYKMKKKLSTITNDSGTPQRECTTDAKVARVDSESPGYPVINVNAQRECTTDVNVARVHSESPGEPVINVTVNTICKK